MKWVLEVTIGKSLDMGLHCVETPCVAEVETQWRADKRLGDGCEGEGNGERHPPSSLAQLLVLGGVGGDIYQDHRQRRAHKNGSFERRGGRGTREVGVSRLSCQFPFQI